ncbi:hypothetical protein BC833DRAFT_566018 [Globomyces pollinis-pini]|nr:hypothetical protein BC833DRAFT_566018 [Globomyces pollinis-pini]
MAATVRVKSGKSEITLNRKRNDFTVLKKKHNRADLDIARLLQAMLEEQNIKVKQLEENTKAQQNMINIRHLTLLKKKNYELENARLQEENAILKKNLGEQNNIVAELEKRTQDLQITIYNRNWELEVQVQNARSLQEENAKLKKKLKEHNMVHAGENTKVPQNTIKEKNSILSSFKRQRCGRRIGIKVNELVARSVNYCETSMKLSQGNFEKKIASNYWKGVKKGIDIYGVGPVTLSIFGFHHVVHFANRNEIELKPLEIGYVNEIFTLLLQCKVDEVPGDYWKHIITTTVIEVSRSRPTVTVAAIQNFFERTVNVDACVQVMRSITDWPVYFNLTAPKTATTTSAKPDEPIFAVKQHQWEHYYFDYVFHRGAVFRDGFHPILQISTKVCVGATNITGHRLLVEDDKSDLARWRIAY